MTTLFVVGAPRSGTTLTRSILRGFGGVYLPPDEIQVLPGFVRAAENGASARDLAAFMDKTVFAGHMRRRGVWPGVARLAAVFEGKGPADAFRAMVLEIAAAENAGPVVLWGDKTPNNVFRLDLVARLWPDVRVLEVVRDPRATVLSMRRSWGRSPLRGAVIWRDAIRAGRRFAATHGAGRLHTLSYEGLTEDPGRELDRLSAWLGMPVERAAFENVASEERWGRSAGRTGVQKRGDDWQGALDPAEQRLIEEVCLDEMRPMGFEPRLAARPRRPGRLALRAAAVGDTARTLKAYARERGWPAALSYKLRQWRHAGQV